MPWHLELPALAIAVLSCWWWCDRSLSSPGSSRCQLSRLMARGCRHEGICQRVDFSGSEKHLKTAWTHLSATSIPFSAVSLSSEDIKFRIFMTSSTLFSNATNSSSWWADIILMRRRCLHEYKTKRNWKWEKALAAMSRWMIMNWWRRRKSLRSYWMKIPYRLYKAISTAKKWTQKRLLACERPAKLKVAKLFGCELNSCGVSEPQAPPLSKVYRVRWPQFTFDIFTSSRRNH